MKTKVYLIRHGETDWNVERRYQGLTDIELSKEGLKQSELLSERFKNFDKIDKIYVSPLKRAVQTAKPLSNVIGVKPIITECFKEINFGEWEGKTVEELRELYKEDFNNFFNNPYRAKFPGDGSLKIVEERVALGFNKILEEDKGKNIIIVSHGGLLKILFLYIMNIPRDFYRNIWIDNTSISMIQLNKENKPLLLTFNDKSHIESYRKVETKVML